MTAFLPRGDTRATFFLLLYRAIQLVNSLAVSVLVARRFGLEMVGTFAIGFVAVMFVTLLAPVGLNSCLPRIRQPHARLCFASLAVQAVLAPFLFLLLFAYSRLQAASPAEAGLIFLVALNGPILALTNIAVTLAVLRKSSWQCLYAAAAETAGVAGGIVLSDSAEGFALALLGGRCAGALWMWTRFPFSRLAAKRIVCIVRRSASFMVPELLGLLAEQSAPLMMAHVTPRAEMGLFRLCQQLLNAADAPAGAFVQARYPGLVHAAPEHLSRLQRRISQLAIAVAALCLAGSSVLAVLVYRIPDLIPLMAVLSMSLFWRYRAHLYEQAFRARGAVRVTSALGAWKLVVALPIFYALISRYGAMGAVCSVALLSLLVEVAYGHVIRRTPTAALSPVPVRTQ